MHGCCVCPGCSSTYSNQPETHGGHFVTAIKRLLLCVGTQKAPSPTWPCLPTARPFTYPRSLQRKPARLSLSVLGVKVQRRGGSEHKHTEPVQAAVPWAAARQHVGSTRRQSGCAKGARQPAPSTDPRQPRGRCLAPDFGRKGRQVGRRLLCPVASPLHTGSANPRGNEQRLGTEGLCPSFSP